MTTPMVAEIAARMIRSGDALKAATWQKGLAERRQTLAAEILEGHDFTAHPAAFQVWLKLPEPWRREEFVDVARRRGVGVAPANAFAVNSLSGDLQHLSFDLIAPSSGYQDSASGKPGSADPTAST
jgi:DNA-binding transcriptional MocR family regulator